MTKVIVIHYCWECPFGKGDVNHPVCRHPDFGGELFHEGLHGRIILESEIPDWCQLDSLSSAGHIHKSRKWSTIKTIKL